MKKVKENVSKVNIRVKDKGSCSIAISQESLFSLLLCTVQNTIHVSTNGILLSCASH